MHKTHIAATALLVFVGLASAQVATSAQAILRVLEIAGQVDVLAQSTQTRDSISWVGQLDTTTGNASEEQVWMCPPGHKARLTFVQTDGFNGIRLSLRRGLVEVNIGYGQQLDGSYAENGAMNLGQPVLEPGDELVWFLDVGVQAKYWVTLELVPL